MSNHDVCVTHTNAMSALSDYKETVARDHSISNHLKTGKSELIKKNRHYIMSVSEALLFCTLQEIGHDESSSFINGGNVKH